MAEHESSHGDDAGTLSGGGMILLEIPEENTQAVLDFVKNLGSTADDVSGHMLSRGVFGGIRPQLSEMENNSMTGCWHTGSNNYDTSCSDSDFH